MEAQTPAEHQPARQTDERLHAPGHIIDLILGVMRQRTRPAGPAPGTVDYARAARAEATVYADRIWAEGWQAGAQWGLAHNTQPIRVTPARFDEIMEAR